MEKKGVPAFKPDYEALYHKVKPKSRRLWPIQDFCKQKQMFIL
jgi:hypothetical protein